MSSKISHLGLLFSISLALTSALPADPLRIMPVGDSITAGDTSPNGPVNSGYRAHLYQLLTGAGEQIQFVGSSSEGTPAVGQETPGYPDLAALGQGLSDGHGGVGTQFVLDNINTWTATQKPDVVLLMIGFNDLSGVSPTNPVTTYEANLHLIVDDILNSSPTVKLVLSDATPWSGYFQSIVDYNNYINSTFLNYSSRLTLVDQYSNFLARDGQGNVIKDAQGHDTYDQSLFTPNSAPHPDQAGYDKMAQTWFDGIQAATVPEPNTSSYLLLPLFLLALWLTFAKKASRKC